MANPAYSYTGQEQYSLISQSAFYRQELSDEVVLPYGDEGLDRFFNVFGMIFGSLMGQGLLLGQAQACTTPDFWHVERQRFMSEIVVDAQSAPSDPTIVLTIQGTDSTTPGSYKTDGTATPIRLGDVYILSTDGKQYIATAQNTGTPYAHTVTLESLGGGNAPAVISGDKLIYLTNLWNEGTGPHESMITEDVLVTGQMQIIKDAFKTTLTANSTMDEVRWPGGLGVPAGNYRVLTDERDAIARQFRNIDLALLLQEEVTNSVTGITRSTKGLLPTIKDSGFTESYSSGSFNIDKFVDINKLLNKQRSPKEYKWITGYDLMNELEEVFHEYFNMQTNSAGSAGVGGAGITYASYMGSKNIALSMGARSFCRGGFTHHFHTYSEWSDQETFDGLVTTKGRLAEEAILIPMQKMANYGDSDGAYNGVGPNPNSMVHPMTVRYLSGNGENRLMETTEFGTRGGTAKGTRDDVFGYDYRSEVGLQIRSAKDFGYVKVV